MRVRTKKRICIAMALTALLVMLGIVGGMDMGVIPFGRGVALSAFCEATGVFLLWKGGAFRR